MLQRIVTVVLLLLCAAAYAGEKAAIESRTAPCAAMPQPYLSYAPVAGAALPVVLLLHGAGDRPENMIAAWKSLADKEHIVLLAPALPRRVEYEDIAPANFVCVVQHARQSIPLDMSRIYVFGNSMGGYLAFDAAMFDSQTFAAVGVHGSRIAEQYTGIVNEAKRKMPIAIYIGDHDQYFSLDSVRRTRDLLKKENFPLHYVEMPSHDHNYYDRSDTINQDVWKFFRTHSLSEQAVH